VISFDLVIEYFSLWSKLGTVSKHQSQCSCYAERLVQWSVCATAWVSKGTYRGRYQVARKSQR